MIAGMSAIVVWLLYCIATEAPQNVTKGGFFILLALIAVVELATLLTA